MGIQFDDFLFCPKLKKIKETLEKKIERRREKRPMGHFTKLARETGYFALCEGR